MGGGPVEVEERRRRDVVAQREVAPATAPAEGLDVDAQLLGEVDRVGEVPTVEAEPLLAHVEPVGPDHLRHAEVGRGELGVALAGDVEVPCAAEVVLRACARDRRELLV